VPQTATLLLVFIMPGLLLASAFFSGSETAIFSLTPHQQRQFRQSKRLWAKSTLTLLGQSSHTLITLLLANMSINVTYFVLSTILLIKTQDSLALHPLVLSGLSTLPLIFIILLGEVLPKLIASKAPDTWCKYTAIPLLWMSQTISPMRQLINTFVIRPLTNLFTPTQPPRQLDRNELQTLINISQTQGDLDQSQQQLLKQVLSLSKLKVKAIMTPRVDLHAFDLEENIQQLYQIIHQHRVSRIPIYKENLDNIQGIILAKQLLLKKPKTIQQLKPLIRQAHFVPELQKSDALLTHFRKTGHTMAIAVDEYGGTAGLVSLQDIVEQIVGHIATPQQSAVTPNIQKLAENQWLIPAETPIEEWTQLLHIPNQWPDLVTMGGLAMTLLGKIPKIGDSIAIQQIQLIVTQTQGNRPTQLKTIQHKAPPKAQ